MKDLTTQISFVVNSVNRILEQIDLDPLSPTFGCAHLAYWRDKTSDVADMRRQEIMLALSLLYSRTYPKSSWKGNPKLKVAVEALLSFWCKNQYSDGSMDEWYKGERAFAATAFSTHAVARTIMVMKHTLSESILNSARDKLEKTSFWLLRNNDLFKTNHQAVGVGALAWAGAVLGKDEFKENAYKKLKSIIRVQNDEGWFPEIGHMDVGYTFLTVEFVVMAMHLWDDWHYIEPFTRAFDFACEWVHPDLTIGKEYGVCHNPYLSRIAVILMSEFSKQAAYIRKRLQNESIDFNGYSSVLADDLRLLRWAYQPFLAYDYAKAKLLPTSVKYEKIPLLNHKATMHIYHKASIGRFTCYGCTGVFAGAAGGLVRLFGNKSGNSITDYGYAISFENRYATNQTYNRNIKIQKKNNVLEISCPIIHVNKFIPSFLARLMLHVACSTTIGSRLTRKVIDIFRKKRGVAINQSSYNMSSSKSKWTLQRQISFHNKYFQIRDKLKLKKKIEASRIFFVQSIDDNFITTQPISSYIENLPSTIENIEIIKYYYPGDNWRLKKILANIKL